MPEYLAPGVYVEETSFRSKTIEGVSTTTTGFIGPTRYGPVDIEPDVVTSLGQFERIYGDRQQLKFSTVVGNNVTPDEPMHNFMWHAARAFFAEGGKRLYVSRVFRPNSESDDGYADAWLPDSGPNADRIRVRARHPGEAGSMRVRITARLGQNALSQQAVEGSPGQFRTVVNGLSDGDIVWVSDIPGSPPSPLGDETGVYYVARLVTDPTTKAETWNFTDAFQPPGSTGTPPATRALSSLLPDANPSLSDKVRVLTLTVTVAPSGASDQPPVTYDGLALSPNHKRADEPDSVFDRFAEKPSSPAIARRIPLVMTRGSNVTGGLAVLGALLTARPDLAGALNSATSTDADRSVDLLLTGGNDGQRPEAAEYEGTARDTDPFKTGLKQFEDIEDISIVAAPGSTFGYENGYRTDAATITNLLISHAERMRYCIAVLDSGDGQAVADVRAMRARIDSKYAAFYYPWVRVLDPVTREEIHLPPSGFVAGIYARNDVNRAVYKAPANEVVNLAIGFEQLLNKAQQEVLNPEGINCFRFFEGRGFRLWGARTATSDPEWKYVNLRRYFIYLERSIDRGTQWAVFEPNGPALWANVRRTIEDFLLNEFQNGALLGDKPETSYFVRCDRSTMTQNDLDNGRLVCLVGVAALRPAEFVIFRIGQWTGDRKV
ncbi:MAG TPA: phage tail sheath subtilisin-like domain-containing protein [Pyrinomonadaceae bacterium]|nr:phage tail sheath subtilisin-like domain-containing protein [Pyrinomonadaceae bacterium]